MKTGTSLKKGILTCRDSGKQAVYRMERLSADHVDSMLKLQEEVLKDGSFDCRWFFPFREEELEEILADENSLVLGIFAEDTLAAFRVGCTDGKEFREISKALGGIYSEGEAMLLDGVFVKKEFRGNHLQQVMSSYTIEACEKRKINAFMTAIHPENIASIKSLENIGFQRKARAMLYGGKYDRVILVKETI